MNVGAPSSLWGGRQGVHPTSTILGADASRGATKWLPWEGVLDIPWCYSGGHHISHNLQHRGGCSSEKRALETVKLQTPGRIISRARLLSLLNPNERSQPRYNDCTNNHRINSVYQTQYSATSLEVKNVMTTSAKDRPQRSK